MSRALLPLFLLATALAQKAPEASEKASPEVEAVLRARVTQFYQYEVDGKFRQAEALVAEEAKDFYYSANKPRYTGFSIKRIEYFDHVSRANVVVLVNRLVPVPGFEGQAVPGAIPSHWKLEKGAWCWYVEPGDLPSAPMPNMALPTPGRAAPGVPLPGGALPGAGLPGGTLPAGGAPGAGASLPPMPNMTAAVVLDKPAIELHSSGPSAGQVTLLSRVRTPVTLILRDPKISGLGMKLDRTDLKNGERAVLSVESNGQAPPQAVIVTIVVKQTNQVIPVRITFAQAARK